jgi:hypothetical protein
MGSILYFNIRLYHGVLVHKGSVIRWSRFHTTQILHGIQSAILI